eukprot:scaffold8910_cov77-Skeletonema_dohrnii-CCMP3373.AAC.3
MESPCHQIIYMSSSLTISLERGDEECSSSSVAAIIDDISIEMMTADMSPPRRMDCLLMVPMTMIA